MRRRAANGALEDAARHFEKLGERPIPEKRRSSYLYEGGYIQLLLGYHENALQYFIKGSELLDPTRDGWQWAAAASLVFQCRVILRDRATHWDDLLQMNQEAEQLSAASEGPAAARWVLNCQLHRVRALIAKGDLVEAAAVHERAMARWGGMITATGWDKAFRPAFLPISGVLKACLASSATDAQEALRYLARAAVGLLGGGGNPEQIRDVLFASADMFMILGEKGHATKLRETAARTRDGSSWLEPYRA
jgi:tetratricopeptide (TPR) repeat protein